MKKLRFDIITIFPHIFDSYLGESLMKRAIRKRLIDVRVHNLRDATDDPHRKVDDRPFGGGPGMVFKIQPVYEAVRRLAPRASTRVILLSPRGAAFTSVAAKRLARYERLILIAGRYEGVDERVAAHIADEELSIGNYVLAGGELAALVVLEAVSRFLPGFLGKGESREDIKGSYPAYTKPAVFSPKKGVRWCVPPALLSGNHARIEAWRKAHAKR